LGLFSDVIPDKAQHILTVTSVKHDWSSKIFEDSLGDSDVNSR